jgi:prolyl oligopeptidase
VPNPYDWLEDLSSHETKTFVTAQNKSLDEYLDDPMLEEPKIKLLDMLQSILGQVVMKQVPHAAGSYYLFRVAGSGREFPVTWRVRKDLIRKWVGASDASLQDPYLQSQLEIFHDEAEEGRIVIASGVSWSGKYWAYNASMHGSDWGSIKVRDVETAQVLADEVHDTKFDNKSVPITWLGDRGFFYQYWEPCGTSRGNPQLRFHTLGRPQAEDEVVYQDPAHPSHCLSVTISDDGSLAFLHIYEAGPISQVCAARILNLDKASPEHDQLDLVFDIDICDNFLSLWE